MAVLTAEYVELVEYSGYSGLFANQETIVQPSGSVRAVEESDSALIGGIYTYVPDVSVPALRVLDGVFMDGYFADYYNRIHINPGNIVLGTLVDTVTESFYIWNAYLDSSKTLTSVNTSGVGGLSLIGLSPPIEFSPNQELEYDLQITLLGSVIIAATYGFVFSGEEPELIITGQRLLVWENRPLIKGTSESLEWKTDVLKAWDAEQRIALRTSPRTILKYSYLLNEDEYSLVKNAALKWSANTFGIPIWFEFFQYGAIASGTYTLTFNNTPYEYYVGGMVYIYDSNSNNQTIEILSMNDASITFEYPINEFVNAMVMPLKSGISTQGTKIKRLDGRNIEVVSQFLIVNDNFIETFVGDGLDYPQYLSVDVITSKQVLVSGFTELIKYGLDFFDNGSGAVLIEKQFANPISTKQISFTARTDAERWNNKVFFYSLYGKQKSFWTLSWSKDINTTVDIVASAKTIICKNIGYVLYRTTSYIAIILNDGTILFNTVTSASTYSATEEALALENILPYDIDIVDIERICFMQKMRLDSDTVTIDHTNYPYAFTKIPVAEVPE